jgi:hypothetical protein
VKSIYLAAVTSFIEKFGLVPLGQCRAVVISTIGTATPQTISCPTWNAYLQASTYRSVGKLAKATYHNTFPKELRPLPQRGIALRKGDCGIGDMPNGSRVGQNGSANFVRATIAGLSLVLLSARAVIAKGFATITAKRLTIASVRPLASSEDVWCITVPDGERYSLANGAVVHNSADAFRYLCMAWRSLHVVTPKPKRVLLPGQVPLPGPPAPISQVKIRI